jgi:hypothetical protein
LRDYQATSLLNEHIPTQYTTVFVITKNMAAEIAAGAYVASEVIEHTAEAGYAAYIVSKPTLPLKATFTRIATTSGDHSGFVLISIPNHILR